MKALRSLSAFVRDETGAMSVEYVIWVPLLMFWLVASVAAFGAFNARNAAANAAYTLADVMSRQAEVDAAFFDDLWALHDGLLPNTSNQKTVRISSIVYDADADTHSVVWSNATVGVTPLVDGRIPTGRLPDMADADSVVLIETAVPYVFFTDWLGQSSTVWRHTLAVRPRFVPAVVLTGGA